MSANASRELILTRDIPLAPLPGGHTRYTARALHWTEENCRKHEEMGFQKGWGQCLDQLIVLATHG